LDALLKNHIVNNKVTPEEQQVAIERLPHYRDLFHPPFFNNFSVVCLNKRYDKKSLVEYKTRSLRKLNVACYNLQIFTRMCLDKMHQLDEYSICGEDFERIDQLEDQWSKAIAEGNSFLTYDYARDVINRIRQTNFPYDEILNSPKYGVVPKAFGNVDYYSKAFVKISVFAPYHEAMSVVESFIALMEKYPLLFYYIERVEMAKQISVLPGVLSFNENAYPALTIFFDSRIVSISYHPAVNELLEKLMPAVESVTEMEFDDTFSRHIGKNTTLSQGFRNYKRYLQLVNIIEEVYDKKTGYAFINS
jgi:hypothetical protein